MPKFMTAGLGGMGGMGGMGMMNNLLQAAGHDLGAATPNVDDATREAEA